MRKGGPSTCCIILHANLSACEFKWARVYWFRKRPQSMGVFLELMAHTLRTGRPATHNGRASRACNRPPPIRCDTRHARVTTTHGLAHVALHVVHDCQAHPRHAEMFLAPHEENTGQNGRAPPHLRVPPSAGPDSLSPASESPRSHPTLAWARAETFMGQSWVLYGDTAAAAHMRRENV